MLFQLLILLVVVVVSKKWLSNRKYAQFPGPSPLLSLPLLGHGYLLGDDPTSKMTELQKKYGNTFRFDIGDVPTIILCKHDQIKSAYFKDVFSGRTWHDFPSVQAIYEKDSEGTVHLPVSASEGPVWVEQRKFMLKSLSDLGMGNRDTMQDVIEQEAEQIAERLGKQAGTPIKSRGFFLTAANNVVWRIATGKRTRQDDPELIDFTKIVVENFQNMDPSDPMGLVMVSSLSVTRLRQLLGLRNYLDSSGKIKDMIKKTIGESKPNENGNYIERALSEDGSDEKGGKTIWAGDHGKNYLVGQLMDLFFAGTDTTATFIEWSIMYLIKYPEEQKKMLQEIRSLTGDGERRIGLSDRSSAHFCNAFFDEVARHCQMGFLPPPHKTMEDVEFEGKVIPKGTQILYFHYGINHDTTFFPEPDTFRPERFLDKNGHYVKDEHMVFFGVGKRRCPGELLARAEYFLFVTRLVQQFQLTAVNPKKLSFTAIPGLVFAPKQYEFTIEQRQDCNF